MTVETETVLIVDDEQVIRSLLQRKLSMDGYHCREAGNTGEAMLRLQDEPVALVILDIMMPGESGTDFLPKIRAGYPNTAVIMATSITNTDIAVQCMKQGAQDYIIKPYNLEAVRLSVGRALEKRRLELENRAYRQHLEQMVDEQAKRIRHSFLNAITSLAYALDAKDKYTSGHSQRVAETSVAIAHEMSLKGESLGKIRLARLIHDIGKIGVKEALLNKATSLTEEEFKQVKYHPEMGEHILKPIVEDEEIIKAVRHHHERYDGRGYPDGLAGGEIPLAARILAVADAYDAMTSERPYRAAMTIAVACSELRGGESTQFDPEVVKVFLDILVATGAAARGK